MKENYIVAKSFFTFVVKYLDIECCELSKIEDCIEYIESQLLIDEDLCVEDFSICIKKNYKEEYLKLLNDYICASLNYWGSESVNYPSILNECYSKLEDYADKYAYENALNSDELDLLGGIVQYNALSKKNWSISAILEKFERIIERKVR